MQTLCGSSHDFAIRQDRQLTTKTHGPRSITTIGTCRERILLEWCLGFCIFFYFRLATRHLNHTFPVIQSVCFRSQKKWWHVLKIWIKSSEGRTSLFFFIACMDKSYFSSKHIRPFVFSRRQSLINLIHPSLIRSFVSRTLSLSLRDTSDSKWTRLNISRNERNWLR